jgi:hypothetical protein
MSAFGRKRTYTNGRFRPTCVKTRALDFSVVQMLPFGTYSAFWIRRKI